MAHSLSGNTLSNATRFSYNSVQGHHHSLMGVERFADRGKLRWSMTVGCLLDPASPAARYMQGAVLKRPILGCGMLIGSLGNTLIISDLHIPYQHQDAFEFLYKLDQYYNFCQVLNVGDLFDHHAGSFHLSEGDAYSQEDEYHKAKEDAIILQQMFPFMRIAEGNHDRIPKRKIQVAGLPESMISNYNKLYGLEDGWLWNKEHWFSSLEGFPVTHPMVMNNKGRWDKVIMKLGGRE